MENQSNFIPTPAIPPLPRQSFSVGGAHKSWGLPAQAGHWLVVVIALISVVGYFIASYSLALWPFEKSSGPIVVSTPRPSPAIKDPTEGWKTYTNTEYGFEFKYPGDWAVTKYGGGEYINATGRESNFFVGENAGIRGISFNISTLKSEDFGAYYQSANNLDDYLKLLGTTDENGNIIRKFKENIRIDGLIAKKFEVYGWSVDYQSNVWFTEIFFEKNNNIFDISLYGKVDNNIFDQILSTFRFVEQSTLPSEEIGQMQLRNSIRSSDINRIWTAVNMRFADNRGIWTIDAICKTKLPITSTYIGSQYADLYPCLEYLNFIPILKDPSVGTTENWGYMISSETQSGRVTVSAPHAELGEIISITK